MLQLLRGDGDASIEQCGQFPQLMHLLLAMMLRATARW
jgi:hypothetical protein